MSKNEEVHVAMLPWVAFGHMIPFLDLSIALAKYGIHVSFLSTPRNIQRLLPKIPPGLSSFIEFVSLPLPKLNSNLLPENAEATTDIPADKMDDLKIAFDLLQVPVKNFIAKKQPNWIIVDFFPHCVVDIAQDFDIYIVEYYMTTACTAVFFWLPEFLAGDDQGQRQARRSPQQLTVPPDWVDFPSKVAYRNHEANFMHNIFYGTGATGIADGTRLTRIVQASRVVAIRTSLELEPDYLRLYSKITGKRAIPVGFVPPGKSKTTGVTQEPWSSIFDWLDRQKPRSVVFVGFGSEIKLSKEQIHEIAYGLEISKLPFLWSLRESEGVDSDVEALPPGFTARVVAEGVVQLGWAPQREILGHPSIGGTLFHAGWGSIIEVMQFGHVLVFLPFIIDQPLNARLMVEKGLGMEVERGEDGSLTRDDIANALRKAMVFDQGQELQRARAEQAAREIFANHEHNQNYVEKFAEYLKNEARACNERE